MNNEQLQAALQAAKDQAAIEHGYDDGWSSAVQITNWSSKAVIDRAMEIYAEMVGINPKSVFVVNAYRWGDRERHSYTLGVFSDIQKAIECANSHTEYRGGKYSCMVESCSLDHFNNQDDDYTKVIYATDCMGYKGFDNTKPTKP